MELGGGDGGDSSTHLSNHRGSLGDDRGGSNCADSSNSGGSNSVDSWGSNGADSRGSNGADGRSSNNMGSSYSRSSVATCIGIGIA